MSGLITVHVRVNDAATGKPTPVRLRIARPDGEFFAPFGRSIDFPLGRNEAVGGHVYLGGKKYVYIDGSCEIQLPTGEPLEVDIGKGPEYEPVRETVVLGPGKMALRFTIRRSIDRRIDGWLSADTRCHFLTPHDALLEASAADLDWVHLLATEQYLPSQDGHLYRTVPNMTAFSGQAQRVAESGAAIVVNTFNTHPALGRLALLNCHRPVFPLAFGSAGDSDDWSICDWCDQCHRKKGLAVWCDAYRSEAGIPGGEALIAAILGKVDAIEMDGNERSQPFLPQWYRLLNAGLHLPLVAGSGKDCNRDLLGSMRTYTLMGSESPGLADWVERTRQGRTFVTNGPLLSFSVNDRPVGDTIQLSDEKMPLRIRASAISNVCFERLEIVVNGRVIADGSPSRGANWNAEIACEPAMPEGGWIAARCVGSAKSELDHRSPIFAHTSPIFVTVEGKPPYVVPAAVQSFRKELEQVRHWIETVGRFVHEKSKAHLLALCDEAMKALDKQ